MVPERVGLVDERDHLRPLVDHLVDRRLDEPAFVVDGDPAERRAGALGQQLPRHDVAVVLHLGDHDLVAGPEPEPLGAQERRGVGERVGQQVQRRRDVGGEDDLVARRRVDEPRDDVAGALERGRRLAAQGVHRPGDVGVVVGVEVGLGVDDHLRLLRAVGGIEVDQRVAVHLAGQDREVLADRLDVQAHVRRSPFPAPRTARSPRPRACRRVPCRRTRRSGRRRTRGRSRVRCSAGSGCSG